MKKNRNGRSRESGMCGNTTKGIVTEAKES